MLDFITHYHPAQDPPFRNLSDAPEDALPAILEGLAARRLSGSKRVFGRRYMPFRRQTEAKLKRLFMEAGGRPQREAPHYFILGGSEWFANLYPDTKSVRLPLSALNPATTSFTYPDSAVSMRLGPDFGLPVDPVRPYHEKVFRLGELEGVLEQFGLPKDEPDEDAYADYHLKEFERYIEVQVWSDDPVAAWLS
nr:hypothetical protein [Mesorhizobium loti]